MGKKKEIDYVSYEDKLGVMYHLLLDMGDSDVCVKYVAEKDSPKYAAVNNQPIYFDWDKVFRIATDYTIIYPKIYVKDSVPYDVNDPIERTTYLQ